MLQPPCRGCTDRYQGCHDRCKAYQEFHAEQETISKARNKENDIYNYSYISHTKIARHLKNKNGY